MRRIIGLITILIMVTCINAQKAKPTSDAKESKRLDRMIAEQKQRREALNLDLALPIGCGYVMDVGTAASNGYKLYFQWATRRKSYDTAEIWTCITPLDRTAYLKKTKLPKTYAYSLQFISIECERSRYTADRLIPYDTKRMPIESRSSLWTSVYGDSIVPGSVGESMKRKLCFQE